MSSSCASRASIRYGARIIVLSLIYAACLIGAVYAFRFHLVAGTAAWFVGALPALPIIGIFAAIGLYLVEERDEYLRMMVTRQTLWASGFSLSLATVWGFLESFGLAGHIPAYWVSVLWFAGLGLGALANRLTMGRAA